MGKIIFGQRGAAVLKIILLVNLLLITACTLVKQDKYIKTDTFRDEAWKLCMDSNKYKQQAQENRKISCQKDAQDFITHAENNFREFKADENNYRLCRAKFADIQMSDRCFNEQQEKYYRRELDGYKSGLN